MKTNARVLSWLAVALVGAVVVALVVGLSLFPRLNAAQNHIDGTKPAFAPERLAGDRAAIDMVDTAVTTVDVTTRQAAAAEVPKLVAFVAKGGNLTEAQVLAALSGNFPHTTGLLFALPLTQVSAELPKLVPFLASTMKMTPAQVTTALQRDFPHLNQAIGALPAVTAGWNNVPGTEQLTRFDNAPVRTVPQVTTYFSADVVPVLENQRTNYDSLASKGGVGFLDGLLLLVGLVVLVFGLLMAYLSTRGVPATVVAAGWGVVVAVGALVIGLVLGLSLFPRLTDGQHLLDGARPAFTDARVAGDQAGIAMLSRVVEAADPIVTPEGGAAAEVPKLLALVGSRANLSKAKVLAALTKAAPHTTGLLLATPLSAVSAELPKLVAFLSQRLNLSQAQVMTALTQNFPNLAAAIDILPDVTSGWNNVPGTAELTRFDGTTPVRTVPAIRDYFAADVIPTVAAQRANFQRVDTTWPPLPVFPPLLLVVGILVVLYGLVMLFLTVRGKPADAHAKPAPARRPSPTRSRA
jgi:hypothetical protein